MLMFMRQFLKIFGLLCLIVAVPQSLHAQVVEDTTAIDIGFDEIEEESMPASSIGGWLDIVNISGRFDFNFEVTNIGGDGDIRDRRFRNYHKFLFLKVTPTEKFTLDAEVLDLSYYELGYNFVKNWKVKVGKIWVPFGASPFHHYYGGQQGDPFSGLLLPNVWSEFGVSIEGVLLRTSNISLDGDFYKIRGFEGQLGNVLNLSNGGSDDIFAWGTRTRLAIGSKLVLWGSVQYNPFGEDDRGKILLWGGDILMDYGLLNLPVLRDLRFRAAFARAEIQDRVLVDEAANSNHWYYRYGDYAEVSYRGIGFIIPRIRYGTIIDFDDRVSNADSHTWDFALSARLDRNFMLFGQYQVIMEEVNEIENDLMRLSVIFEF